MKLGITLTVIGLIGATMNFYIYIVDHIHVFGMEWLVAAPCLFFGIRRITKHVKNRGKHNADK